MSLIAKDVLDLDCRNRVNLVSSADGVCATFREAKIFHSAVPVVQ